MLFSRSAAGGPRAWIRHRDDVQIASWTTRRTSAAVHSHLTRTWVACAHALCRLPSEKPCQDAQHLGRQVAQSGLDVLLGSDGISLDLLLAGGIAHLQGLKAEAVAIVVDEGDVRVALRRLPEGAVQEDASRVDAERCHQSLPEADQSLLVEGQPIARLHQCGSPLLSSAGALSDPEPPGASPRS